MRRLGGHVRPVEQQIVVVEHALLLLRLDVRGEQHAQIGLPFAAPRKRVVEHLAERRAGVHDARIDRKARALGREAPLFRRQAEFVAHEIHQVGGIFAVVDREGRREADQIRVLAQQPRADAMERARPRQPLRERGSRAERRAGDARDAAGHFERRAARKGQQQDAARIGALHHQIGDPMRERVGLAGAGARDHQQRAGRRGGRVGAVFDGFALRVVELRQPGGGVGRGTRDGGARIRRRRARWIWALDGFRVATHTVYPYNQRRQATLF